MGTEQTAETEFLWPSPLRSRQACVPLVACLHPSLGLSLKVANRKCCAGGVGIGQEDSKLAVYESFSGKRGLLFVQVPYQAQCTHMSALPNYALSPEDDGFAITSLPGATTLCRG